MNDGKGRKESDTTDEFTINFWHSDSIRFFSVSTHVSRLSVLYTPEKLNSLVSKRMELETPVRSDVLFVFLVCSPDEAFFFVVGCWAFLELLRGRLKRKCIFLSTTTLSSQTNFFRILMASMQLLRCIVMLFDQASSMQKEEENMQLKVAHQPLGKAVTTLGWRFSVFRRAQGKTNNSHVTLDVFLPLMTKAQIANGLLWLDSR